MDACSLDMHIVCILSGIDIAAVCCSFQTSVLDTRLAQRNFDQAAERVLTL